MSGVVLILWSVWQHNAFDDVPAPAAALSYWTAIVTVLDTAPPMWASIRQD